ncbi:MAG TPA: HAD family hydrolase [Acidimicrobiales bacterium]|nr:HAD family hydrolase [Acidimicrobiales bacterium]
MGVEAVVFDWGGTLSVWADVDVEDVWRLAARHLAPEREAELVEALVRIEARSFERARTDRHSTRLADLLAQASAELGVDVAGAVLEEAAGHHLDSWTPHIRHHSDARGVLTRLRAAGLRLGLLSNTHWPPGFHEHLLDRDGLAELIDRRLYTSAMDLMKPDPSVFRRALDALGVDDPGAAVFVGDRLYDDVWGAQSAGLRAVWVRNTATPTYEVEPDGVIDSLSELPALLSGWGCRLP